MALYRWSTLINNQVIGNFDPANDIVQFDTLTISAADLVVQSIGNTTRVSVGGKTVTIGVPLYALTTGNADFVNNTQLGVGDDQPTTQFDHFGGEFGTGEGNDQLIAGNGGYVMYASGGNDVMTGGTGDDALDGGTGTDTMSGGPGNDLYYVYDTTDVVIERPNEGRDAIVTAVSFTLPANVETLILFSNDEDAINGTGNDLPNWILGTDGPNILIGNGGNDDLDGGNGDDWLIGGAGADVFDGGAGFDVVDYSFSPIGLRIDMSGNAGGSTGEAAGDQWAYIESVLGTRFDDRIYGDNLDNILRGEGGNDYINGTTGNDTLMGGDGNDTLDGELGDDVLFGGAGNDTFFFESEQNDGTVVADFTPGDRLIFQNYGLPQDGARLIRLDATHYQIVSGFDEFRENVTFLNGATINPGDYVFV